MPLTQQPPAGPSWSWAAFGALVALALGILGIAIQYVRGLIKRGRADGVISQQIATLSLENAAQEVKLADLGRRCDTLGNQITQAATVAAESIKAVDEAEDEVHDLADSKSKTHTEIFNRIAHVEAEVAAIKARCDTIQNINGSGPIDTRGIPRRRCGAGGEEP